MKIRSVGNSGCKNTSRNVIVCAVVFIYGLEWMALSGTKGEEEAILNSINISLGSHLQYGSNIVFSISCSMHYLHIYTLGTDLSVTEGVSGCWSLCGQYKKK